MILTCQVKLNVLKMRIYAHIIKYYGQKTKQLYSLGKMQSFFILGATFKIKVSDESLPFFVRHADEFGKYFPEDDQ